MSDAIKSFQRNRTDRISVRRFNERRTDRMAIKKFNDRRFARLSARFDDDIDWITVNGAHIPLDEEGKARAGGNLKGEDLSNAKSSNTKSNPKHEISPSRDEKAITPLKIPKFTKSELKRLERNQLETIATATFANNFAKNGGDLSEGVRRAKALLNGNTTAQLIKYISKNNPL